MTNNTDIQFDVRHIWHPYTSMSTPLPCYPVDSASGVMLTLEDGRKLIDGMSSWWAVLHGYNHPVINNAIKVQLDKMAHVMFGGITHKPAIELCKKLVELTPDNLECVFLADSGSVAVEVALKMAFQYWHAKGEKRHRILSLSHAYHGDTFGAMAVCDPVNSMHSIYEGYLPNHLFAPAFEIGYEDEWNESTTANLRSMVAQYADEISAIIVEPIVQGAGGMRIYHPNYLKTIRELCDEYGILLIADEIATGFGRTGKFFACEHAQISPDILCIGKALTGGYMTLSATITTRHIADTISNGEAKCFMHGPTFMGNPLACSAALASLSLLDNAAWQHNVHNIETQLKAELAPLQGHNDIADIRVLGAIGVIELKRGLNQEKAQQFFVEHGVWIRPFNKLVYIMPPYVISPSELSQLTGTLVKLLQHPDFEEYLNS